MGMKVNGTSGLTFPDTTTLASAGQASVRAWVNFNGTGTPAIRASYNVSSITDNGAGDFTLNFTTALPDADYSFQGNANSSSDSISNHDWAMVVNLYGTKANYITSSSCRIKVTGSVASYGLTDSLQIHCAIFR